LNISHKNNEQLLVALEKANKKISSLETDLQEAQKRIFLQDEAPFRNIIDASPVPYALNDEKQNITYLNPAFIQTFGYDLNDIPTLSDWWPRAYPDPDYLNWVAATWQQHLEEARRDGTPFKPLELVIRCKDGSNRTVLVSAASLTESFKGNHLVILYDITERKKMERSLADSESRYRTLVENVPGVTYRCKCDEYWTMKFISQEIESLSGYSSGDFLENAIRSYASIIHPEDVAIVDQAVLEGVNNRRTYTIEYRIVHASGSIRWVYEKGQAVFDNDGNVKWLDGVILDLTESKRAEQLLRNSEQKYRLLFENMTSGFALHDIICDDNGTPVDYRFLEMNPAFERLTGADAKQLIGKTIRDVLPDTEQYWIDHYGKVALTGEPAAFDNYSKEFDKYYDTWAFSPEKNKFAVIFNDITERKKAEQALQEGNSYFRVLFDQSSFGVAKIDSATGRFEKINTRYAQMLGYSVEEMLQMDFQTITAAEDLQADLASMERLRKGEISTVQFEKRYSHKDGSIVWVNLSILPLSGSGSAPDYYLAIVEDISKRKRAEAFLQFQKDEQQQIVNSMVEGVITIDEAATIQSFNSSAESMFGYKANEVIGKNVKILMPASYAAHHDDYVSSYLSANQPAVLGIPREVSGLRSNGEVFHMRLSVAELPKSIDGKRRFIGSCQDVTVYKQQEEQLRRSQKMDALGNLTGGIAHDYNNVLGVIQGYSQLLQDELKGEPRLKKFADQISHASDRGRKLSSKLLAFTRKKEPEASRVNLNTVILAEKDLLEKTLTPRIPLVLNLDEQLWPTFLDSADLEDAILNLSINAMHAMEAGGELTISTHNKSVDQRASINSILKVGDYVQLTISDSGAGMDLETQRKIFDPFFTTKGENGVGLGLSMVYAFVNRSGGEVEVISAPGKGTRFDFYFPRYVELNTEVESEDKTRSGIFSGNESILVVDDEKALAEMLKATLSMKGYNVVTATNANQALDILDGQEIDLMISDVVMPDIDGFRLAEKVKQSYPATRIQLVSGYADNYDQKCDDQELKQKLMYKPFDSQDLLKRIREIFDGEPSK